jgi:hypothetical protein
MKHHQHPQGQLGLSDQLDQLDLSLQLDQLGLLHLALLADQWDLLGQ